MFSIFFLIYFYLQICLLILNKGELQLSEKERKEMQDNKFKEISVLIAGTYLL